MINDLKNQTKGITLVALVVTIVVLLILAGISVNYAIGQNGIITKAKQAKEGSEGDPELDAFRLLGLEWEEEKHLDKYKDLETFLKAKVDDETIDSFEESETSGTYTIKLNQYSATIDNNGTITQ